MSAAIFTTGDRRWIVARFDPALNPRVLRIPGSQWDRTRNAWRWPYSDRTASDLVTVLEELDGVDMTDDVARLVSLARVREESRLFKLTDVVPPIELPLHGQPEHWVHQRRAFHFARELPAAGIFIGMGGGKSRVAVDLVRDAGDEKVLIICPKNVIGVWPKQFQLYAPDEYRIVYPTKGSVAKRAEEIQRVMDLRVPGVEWPPLVVIVNYDSAWRSPMAKLLLDTDWDRVILDESHRVKSPSGKATKFVAKLAPSAKRRLCLTGTPMPHSPLDVYGQYRFLDRGIFGTSHLKFRNRYAVLGGFPRLQWNPETRQQEMLGTEVIGWQNEEELAERTYSIAYRIADTELDEILGLEPPVHVTRDVQLSAPESAVYKRMYRDFCADVGAGLVVADNALVRLLRLAQVTSGYLPDPDDPKAPPTLLGASRAQAFEELLDDLPPDEQVVVFARFTHDLDEIERVAGNLGRSYAELSGRRRDGLTDEATLGDAAVTGVNIRSGGEGVDFSRSHYCVLYSVGFSLGDYEQALKRTHRPGQKHRVEYLHLVAPNTVDEQVYAALREHKDVVEYVLGLAQ